MPDLVARQIQAQKRLRELVAAGVAGAWAALTAYDEADVAGWLATVLPLIAAADRQAVSITDGYVAAILSRPPLGLDPAAVTQGVRAGVSDAELYRRPFVTVWTALKNGTPYDQAVDAGRARAVSMATANVQLTHRTALQAVQDRDPTIRGWRRVADPGACSFCAAIDGAYVRSARAMPLHNGCGCALRPSQGPVTPTPLPDTVAVHEHDEMGAYLASADHDFAPAPS